MSVLIVRRMTSRPVDVTQKLSELQARVGDVAAYEDAPMHAPVYEHAPIAASLYEHTPMLPPP